MNTQSPVVDEVRRRRMEISAEFGHDVRRYCEHLMQMQQRPEYRDRLVNQVRVVKAPPEALAAHR